jgi:hypothetical protein
VSAKNVNWHSLSELQIMQEHNIASIFIEILLDDEFSAQRENNFCEHLAISKNGIIFFVADEFEIFDGIL